MIRRKELAETIAFRTDEATRDRVWEIAALRRVSHSDSVREAIETWLRLLAEQRA